MANAFIAHLAGDEQLPAGQASIQTYGLSLRAWLVIQNRSDLFAGWWHDLAPPDNDLTINLASCAWR